MGKMFANADTAAALTDYRQASGDDTRFAAAVRVARTFERLASPLHVVGVRDVKEIGSGDTLLEITLSAPSGLIYMELRPAGWAVDYGNASERMDGMNHPNRGDISLLNGLMLDSMNA